jgi:hypothetical protein
MARKRRSFSGAFKAKVPDRQRRGRRGLSAPGQRPDGTHRHALERERRPRHLAIAGRIRPAFNSAQKNLLKSFPASPMAMPIGRTNFWPANSARWITPVIGSMRLQHLSKKKPQKY